MSNTVRALLRVSYISEKPVNVSNTVRALLRVSYISEKPVNVSNTVRALLRVSYNISARDEAMTDKIKRAMHTKIAFTISRAITVITVTWNVLII